MKIRRRCACGCGGVTGIGKKYIYAHNRRGKKLSEETKEKMSLSAMGNTRSLGNKHSKETRLKISLGNIRYDPSDEYCDEWRDTEYIKDLLKDHCENANCKGIYKKLDNHHINLNKKDCRPSNVITLCMPCHMRLHWKLGREKDHKDYLTINRTDKITYVLKRTGKALTLKRIEN